jgi:hypothetical protein
VKIEWRKSSQSQAGGECVELAGLPAAVAVRDSKSPTGPLLRFSRNDLAVLLRTIKSGDLDV